jgi:hypothetical protein
MEEPPIAPNESILKPKAKRTLTDEQRLVLANRMRAVNDKRIADAMAKKEANKPKAPEPPVPAPKEPEPPISTPKVQKKKRMVRVVELSENEEDDLSSESEEEIIIVPKKKVVTKKKIVTKKPAEEEEEEPKKLTKSKPVPKPVPKEEPPKMLYRFL